MRLFLTTAILAGSIVGCQPFSVIPTEKVKNDSRRFKDGVAAIPVYKKVPYLFVLLTPKLDKDGKVTNQYEYKYEVKYLASKDIDYYIEPETSMGNTGLEVHFNADGSIASINGETDAQVDEFITSLGSLVTAAASVMPSPAAEAIIEPTDVQPQLKLYIYRMDVAGGKLTPVDAPIVIDVPFVAK